MQKKKNLLGRLLVRISQKLEKTHFLVGLRLELGPK